MGNVVFCSKLILHKDKAKPMRDEFGFLERT